MHLIYNLGFLLAAWKWGDWRNWQKYYSTILYFVMGDLLNNFINYKWSFWTYHGTFHFSHTFISLLIMFVAYPSTVLIYLGRFPEKGFVKKLLWWGFWLFAYILIEFINNHYLHLISYHNGWSLKWSILFNMFIFTMLRVHQLKPVAAWGMSIVFAAFLWIMFHSSFGNLK